MTPSTTCLTYIAIQLSMRTTYITYDYATAKGDQLPKTIFQELGVDYMFVSTYYSHTGSF